MNSSRFLVFLAVWAVVATVAGALHLFLHLPPVGVQGVIVLVSLSFSVALARVSWLRSGAEALPVKAILAFHLTRFVGIWFLWLYAQGRMPAEFAQRAGWGDIAAAVGAMVLLVWPMGRGFWRALVVWNVLAAVDLFVAVGTAGWLNRTRPGSMIELAVLPLALIPLFLVPVLIGSHFVLLRRGAGKAFGAQRVAASSL